MDITGNLNGLASAGGLSSMETFKKGLEGEVEDLKTQQDQGNQDDSSSQTQTATGGGKTEEVTTQQPTQSKDTGIQSKIDEKMSMIQELDAQITQMRASQNAGLEKEKNKSAASG